MEKPVKMALIFFVILVLCPVFGSVGFSQQPGMIQRRDTAMGDIMVHMTQNMKYTMQKLNDMVNDREIIKAEVMKMQADEMQEHLKVMSDQMQAMMTNLQDMSRRMGNRQSRKG